MKKPSSNVLRMANLIHRELAYLTQVHLQNKLGIININAVKLSADGSFADVYVNFFSINTDEENKDDEQKIAILKSYASFLRFSLAKNKNLQKQKNPFLRFFIDDSVENARKVYQLIDKINPSL